MGRTRETSSPADRTERDTGGGGVECEIDR